ncbi:uncharacterized protein [Vulpes vulpes]|uniref:Uncharacterized protein n=1 Tax=Vulpes vulpes TaxID=9627 RepID=A0ABM4XSL9_VULVU
MHSKRLFELLRKLYYTGSGLGRRQPCLCTTSGPTAAGAARCRRLEVLKLNTVLKPLEARGLNTSARDASSGAARGTARSPSSRKWAPEGRTRRCLKAWILRSNWVKTRAAPLTRARGCQVARDSESSSSAQWDLQPHLPRGLSTPRAASRRGTRPRYPRGPRRRVRPGPAVAPPRQDLNHPSKRPPRRRPGRRGLPAASWVTAPEFYEKLPVKSKQQQQHTESPARAQKTRLNAPLAVEARNELASGVRSRFLRLKRWIECAGQRAVLVSRNGVDTVP